MVRLKRLRLVAAFLLGFAVVTCQEPAAVRKNRTASDSSAVLVAQRLHLAALMQAAAQSGQCHGIPEPGCTVTFMAVPTNWHCAVDFPCLIGDRWAQHEPVVVTFSKPIYQLVVYSGDGSFTCAGTYGTVTAYNRVTQGHGGQQVEQRDFVLQFPEDCGYDQQTGIGVDTLKFPGGIAKLVITPPQPWEYPVWTSDTTPPEQGYMQTEYFYYFYEQRPPTAPCLTGDELLDQQAMRDFLLAAWDSSRVNDVPTNRRETPGYLFEDSTGNLVSRLYQHPGMDTPCESFVPFFSALPDIPLASGHTHPFAPRDTLFPPICGLTTPQLYDTTTYGGASHFDIPAFQGDSVPFYILDKHNIYAFPAKGVTLDNAKSMVRTYPRVDPQTGCTRL